MLMKQLSWKLYLKILHMTVKSQNQMEMRLEGQSQIMNNLRAKLKIMISSQEPQKSMKTSKGQK